MKGCLKKECVTSPRLSALVVPWAGGTTSSLDLLTSS